MESIGFGFLPYAHPGLAFTDAINLIEILSAVCEEDDFQGALRLLVSSTFERHHAISALIIAEGSELEAENWNVTHQFNLRESGDDNKLLTLNSNHKIVKLIRQNRVTRANSNGTETQEIPIITSLPDTPTTNLQESHGIICIPLILNLEAHAGLVVVLEKQVEISGIDQSLLAGLQAIFSFFYFKRRRDPILDFSQSDDFLDTGTISQLTYVQVRIARLLLEGKSDEAITFELELTSSDFQKHYKRISEYLFAESKDEIIRELRLMGIR